MSACTSCRKPIIRRVEQPLPGEVRRISWECKCERGGIQGAMVEWGNKTMTQEQMGAMGMAQPTKKSHWRTGPETFYK